MNQKISLENGGIQKPLKKMSNLYLKIIQNFSNDNAYETSAKVVIKYRRYHDGKTEQKKIRTTLNNLQLNNVVFMIRRGYSYSEIMTYINEQNECNKG